MGLGILVAIGVMVIIFASAVLVIGAIRHFFPMVEPMIPDSFKKGLSFQYGAYYLLAGLVLILIGQV
ncbi:MAG: hypothetical protein WAQ53_01190 [Thiofilum sp.]|uniref:hypothetical protein n=1 Tax=Thiofilum sp. TaxID=2212733 RepID=UPI0025E25B19|nr:hypothetical protein [Thiofilum sp.]MBK8455503.1 hypothetical protein [Thiofilum sp.]